MASLWSMRFSLVLDDILTVSFQRYVMPDSGIIHELPSSLGALPIACRADGSSCVPVAEGEAFWIAAEPTATAIGAKLEVCGIFANNSQIDVPSGQLWSQQCTSISLRKPLTVVAGVSHPEGGFFALSRIMRNTDVHVCNALEIFTQDETRMRHGHDFALLSYASFFRMTRLDPPIPINPDHGYKGWRLP